MHELSVAMGIVEMAAEEAARRGGARVGAVHLRLGRLSGVVREALLFSYDVACEGTPLEGSRLVVEDVAVVAYCPACEAETSPAAGRHFRCPACDGPTPQVLRGREIEVVALELEQ